MVRCERAARAAHPLVLALVGVLYCATAARSILGGDNGELVAVGVSGGIAHPPGYPLYTMLLRASAVVPGAASPAHGAALVTAGIATIAAAALAWAARAWGASRLSATAAAALFAVSPLAWKLGTHAEVFSLNILFAMLVVGWASPRRAPPFGREDLRAGVLGLVAGLGLSNHHSIVLLAPVGLYGVVRAIVLADRRLVGRLRAALAAVVGLAVGLLPHAYLPIRANALAVGQGCVWGTPRDLAGVLRHFLREEYGTFRLAISEAEPTPLAHLVGLLETVFVDLFGAPLVLIVGVVAFIRTRERSAPWTAHAGHAALVASLVLAGPAFVARFNLSARGLAFSIAERFHLLPLALVCVLVALSIDVILRALAIADGERAAQHSQVAAAVLAAVVVARAVVSFPIVREHHRPTTELYVRNVLATVPENAIVLHSGDDLAGGFMYARCALGLRPDVEAIAPRLLLNDWYPGQVSARMGIAIVRGERSPGAAEPTLSARELLDQLVATGRPVFVTDWFAPGIDKSTPSYPIGPLVRVVRSWRDVPDPATLASANEDVFSRMTLEPTSAARTTWAGRRMLDYARPWDVLANAAASQGDRDAEERYRRRARELMPR